MRIGRSRTGLGLLLVATLLLGIVYSGQGGGRWMTHIATNPGVPGVVGKPVDTIPVPETVGHWCWLAWYDMTQGIWTWDEANPYSFSNGSVEWQIPAYNNWYFLLIYDTVTGIFY